MKLQSFLLLTFLVATGCSNDKSSVNKKFFIKGDPISLLKGTKSEEVTSFTKENYSDFNDYILTSTFSFEEKSESILDENLTLEELQDRNAPISKKDNKTTTTPFSFKKINNYYLFSGTLGGKNLKLPFKENADGFFIFDRTSYNSFSDSNSKNTSLLHFSITPDKRAFSVLLSQNTTSSGRVLTSYYFIKDQDSGSLIENLSEFFYTNPLNALIGWDQSEVTELNTCHTSKSVKIDGLDEPLKINEDIIKSWEPALQNRLNINYGHLNESKPYSDLNQNCIFFNEDLLREENPDAISGGITFSVYDISQSKVLTSNIIIFAKEMSKGVEPLKEAGVDPNNNNIYSFQREMDSVLIHEIGHFLQLDHNFDGPQTVMSYVDARSTLYEYDYEAIEHLYPLIN